MADIELLIKIPEEMYKAITYGANGFSNYLHSATRIGTPLPKGHGDLIDRNVAREAMMFEMSGTGYQSRALDVLRSDIYTPTIIEADEGEEEE